VPSTRTGSASLPASSVTAGVARRRSGQPERPGRHRGG
jgi:hypothetical protein